MTLLPNALIDSSTGLPIPTIAAATNAGVSVIKDDNTVVDIYRTKFPKPVGCLDALICCKNSFCRSIWKP